MEKLERCNYVDSSFDLDECPCYDFIKERKEWVCKFVTNRGLDNGYGTIYWSPKRNCYCAENSHDDPSFMWNIAKTHNQVLALWKQYQDDTESDGFVEWLMTRPNAKPIYYTDILMGEDPGPISIIGDKM